MYNREHFEERVKPLLDHIGAIAALVFSVLYILIVFVLIRGFEFRVTSSMAVFAIVNAVIGLLILEALKLQGQLFAKALPENLAVTTAYYGTKTKDKKLHSMRYFWVTSIIKDIFIKGLGVVATTMGVIYIVVVGSHDWNLLLLALCNLLMFISFGIMAMGKAYDYYNDFHIPYLKEQLKE